METNNQSWKDIRYLAIDIEGNGHQPPDVVELGIVIIEDGYVTSAPQVWLVRPEKPITHFATRIHHISNKDVASAPDLESVQADILNALCSDYIIAHNASADYGVLSRKFTNWKPRGVLDTLRMARKIVPGLKSYSLDKLVSEFNLDFDLDPIDLKPHRAGYDALIAARLFLYLLNHENANISTISDIISIGALKLASPPLHSPVQQELF
jgi:exodeoxyribonuclease X